MLSKEYLRDGTNQIIGSETSGFTNDETVARDAQGQIIGRSNDKYAITRDASGRIVSNNASDVDLLFRP
jgi:YD repeat-containing protein